MRNIRILVALATAVLIGLACDAAAEPDEAVARTFPPIDPEVPLFPTFEIGKAEYIDKDGVVKLRVDGDMCAYGFSHGLSPVRSGKKGWGYINGKGQWSISPQFQGASPFRDGAARVGVGNAPGKVAFIDKTGKRLFDRTFPGANDFAEGRAAVHLHQFDEQPQFAFIDKTGKIISDRRFDRVGDFHEGLAWVKVGPSYGYIDREGKIAIEIKYEGAGDFSDGLADAGRGGRGGFINKTGEWAFEPKFNYADDFSEGLAPAGISPREGVLKIGYINRKGEWVIKPQFYRAAPFSEGVAAVAPTFDGEVILYGYIDRSGAIVLEPKYTIAMPFKDDVAVVQFDDKRLAYIRKSGKVIWPKNP